MSGSSFGTILKVTTWGESHGPAVGAVLDGFPAGMPLSVSDIQPFLDRRKPGRTAIATQRREADEVEILSGVFEGVTTGTPISLLIRNTDQHSADYADLASCYRPGHADFGYQVKYGLRDYRGGGRSSGRETAGRVAAGAVAEKLLKELGVDILCYTGSIGPVCADMARFDRDRIYDTATAMPDAEADREAVAYIAQCRSEKDSVGGRIECIVHGLPAGIGDPVFEKLDARLAQAFLSIGAVKAVSFGDGATADTAKGSQNNDAFRMENGSVHTKTNHAGGILGGISDGADIVAHLVVKPTPSISREQETVDTAGQERSLVISGRHDPVIVPRAVVVAESMCALTLLDSMLLNMSAKVSGVLEFYK
jgi:chorismate synthase